MKTTLRTALVAAVATLLLVAPSGAQERQDGGSFAGVPEASESYKLADGSTVDPSPSEGFLVTDDASSPLHLVDMGCTGSSVVSSDGNSSSGGGHCVIVDQGGDVIWAWWLGDQDGGTWGFMGGTGKFAGAQGDGTWTNDREFPSGKFINKWKMTWRVK